MGHHGRNIVGLAVALCIAATIWTPTQAARAGARGEGAQLAIDGRVLDSSGAVAAAATVTVDVSDPSAMGDSNINPVEASTTTGSDGSYELEFDVKDPTAVADVAGHVAVEVIATTADGQLVIDDFGGHVSDDNEASVAFPLERLTHVDLQVGRGLVSTPHRAIVPTPDDGPASPAIAIDLPDATDTNTDPSAVSHDVVDHTDPRNGLRPDVPAGANPDAAAQSHCLAGEQFRWFAQDEFRDVFVPIEKADTMWKTRETYTWSTTTNTQTGVAFDIAGDKVGGGLTYSKTNSTSAGLVYDTGIYSAERLRAQWVYAKYRGWCVYPDPAASYPLNVWKWSPDHWKGPGSRVTVESHYSFQCPHARQARLSTHAGWVSRASTLRMNGYFSLLGVKLSAQQENSKRHRLTFHLVRNDAPAILCGSDNEPQWATKVREKDTGTPKR